MTPSKPLRIFLVTFDIPAARPGDPRYRDVDRFLERYGKVFKPLKQVRLLVTEESPKLIARGVRFRIGGQGSTSILRIGKYSAIDCIDPGTQKAMRSLIRTFGR